MPTAPTYHPKPLTLVASVPVTRHLAALIGLNKGRVVEGMDVTYDGTTLHLAAGEAIVNRDSPGAAYYITFVDPVDVALTNNATNYIFLVYNATIVVNTSGTPPADSIPLYSAITLGGVVTDVTDLRSDIVDIGVKVKMLGASLGNQELTDLGAPNSASSGARLQDVMDALTSTGGARNPVRAATTANITLSGLQTIDGVILASQDRVLVKNQATGSQNGILVAQSGSWTRATDFDSADDIQGGTLVAVSEGTVNGGAVYGLDTDNPVVVGTTALTFTRKDVQAHEALTTAHGAVSAPTPLRLVLRDAAGRAEVAAASASGEIVNKGQMDTAIASEASARSAADTSAIATSEAYADSAVAAEAANRSAGDTAARARANHTGTQTASTISDFDIQVRNSRLDQMAAPTADVSMNTHRLTNLLAPASANDAARFTDIQPSGFMGNLNPGGNATGFVGILGPGGPGAGAGNESSVEFIVPRAMTLANLYAKNTAAAVGPTVTMSLTVRKNGADTALTVSFAANDPQNTLRSITGQSVSFVPGDRICLKYVTVNSSPGIVGFGLSS